MIHVRDVFMYINPPYFLVELKYQYLPPKLSSHVSSQISIIIIIASYINKVVCVIICAISTLVCGVSMPMFASETIRMFTSSISVYATQISMIVR